jgi:hypothetical protein
MALPLVEALEVLVDVAVAAEVGAMMVEAIAFPVARLVVSALAVPPPEATKARPPPIPPPTARVAALATLAPRSKALKVIATVLMRISILLNVSNVCSMVTRTTTCLLAAQTGTRHGNRSIAMRCKL